MASYSVGRRSSEGGKGVGKLPLKFKLICLGAWWGDLWRRLLRWFDKFVKGDSERQRVVSVKPREGPSGLGARSF